MLRMHQCKAQLLIEFTGMHKKVLILLSGLVRLIDHRDHHFPVALRTSGCTS